MSANPRHLPWSQRLRAAGSAWLAVLALSVVLAPWLGALHQVVHARAAEQAPQEHAHFQELFGHHGDPADCLAYDQLTHGDALPSVSHALPPASGPLALAQARAQHVEPRPTAAFHARAPPSHFA